MPASELYLAHLAPSLNHERSLLESHLQEAQSENAKLLDAILQQRREIASVVSSLETVIADVDASTAAPPTDDMEALTEDAVLLDADLHMNR